MLRHIQEKQAFDVHRVLGEQRLPSIPSEHVNPIVADGLQLVMLKDHMDHLRKRRDDARQDCEKAERVYSAAYYAVHMRDFWLLVESTFCLPELDEDMWVRLHWQRYASVCDGCRWEREGQEHLWRCTYIHVCNFYLCIRCMRAANKLHRIYKRYETQLRLAPYLPRNFPFALVCVVRAYISAYIIADECDRIIHQLPSCFPSRVLRLIQDYSARS